MNHRAKACEHFCCTQSKSKGKSARSKEKNRSSESQFETRPPTLLRDSSRRNSEKARGILEGGKMPDYLCEGAHSCLVTKLCEHDRSGFSPSATPGPTWPKRTCKKRQPNMASYSSFDARRGAGVLLTLEHEIFTVGFKYEKEV